MSQFSNHMHVFDNIDKMSVVMTHNSMSLAPYSITSNCVNTVFERLVIFLVLSCWLICKPPGGVIWCTWTYSTPLVIYWSVLYCDEFSSLFSYYQLCVNPKVLALNFKMRICASSLRSWLFSNYGFCFSPGMNRY